MMSRRGCCWKGSGTNVRMEPGVRLAEAKRRKKLRSTRDNNTLAQIELRAYQINHMSNWKWKQLAMQVYRNEFRYELSEYGGNSNGFWVNGNGIIHIVPQGTKSDHWSNAPLATDASPMIPVIDDSMLKIATRLIFESNPSTKRLSRLTTYQVKKYEYHVEHGLNRQVEIELVIRPL